jgi:hypothetical protein
MLGLNGGSRHGEYTVHVSGLFSLCYRCPLGFFLFEKTHPQEALAK